MFEESEGITNYIEDEFEGKEGKVLLLAQNVITKSIELDAVMDEPRLPRVHPGLYAKAVIEDIEFRKPGEED